MHHLWWFAKTFEEYAYFKEKNDFDYNEWYYSSRKNSIFDESLREDAPSAFGEVAVEIVEDYKALTKTFADGQVEQLDFDPSNVLKYLLADAGWIAAVPNRAKNQVLHR